MTEVDSRRRRVLLGARAAVAIVTGLVVTFTPNHTAGFGLAVLGAAAGAFAVVTTVDVVGTRRERAAIGPLIVRAVVHLIVAVVAFVALLTSPTPPLAVFVLLLGGWAALIGGSDVLDGVRLRRAGQRSAARDPLLWGAITLALAVAVFAVPPDFREPWRVADTAGGPVVEGVVTASIFTVGLWGAWAIVAGVLGMIAALGPRETPHS